MTVATARAQTSPHRDRPDLVSPPGPARRTTALAIIFLLLVDLALCLVYLVNVALPIPSGTFLRLANIDGEESLANWYSSAKLLTAAALFLVFAMRNFDRSRASSWPLLLFPVLFLAMSADESVQIHEWLGRKTDIFLPGGDRAGTIFHVTGIWMFVIGLPFMALVLGLIYCTRRFFLPAPGVTRKLVLGVCIFLSGAIGVEVITNYVSDPQSLGFHLEVCAEELLEMWGITVVLWALHDLLAANGFSIRLEPIA